MGLTRRNFILALMALPAAAALSGPLGRALALPRPRLYADGACFDGTTDYLTRGAGLLDTADSRSGTMSFWCRKKLFGGFEVTSMMYKASALEGKWLTVRVGG